MKFVGSLPEGLVRSLDTVAGFFNTRIQPMLGFSSGLTSALPSAGNRYKDMSEDDRKAVEFEEKMFPKILQRINQESIQGLSTDALLLLKRGAREDVWGPWVDLDRFVPLIAELERSRVQKDGSADGAMPLKVEVFYGEKDVMIGTGAGPKWFDECWRPEQRGAGIEYSSETVKGTDHDNLMHLRSGVSERIFKRIPEHGP